jgi:S-sulfo-L-cysteine synthase (O-acetyl-L-serine-dependent)
LMGKLWALEKKVGHTPLHRISQIFTKKDVTIYAKKEWMQLSGSVKARAAYRIIRTALENGELTPQISLLDATSGNTGIAYATIAKLLGLKVTLCLPENASQERKDILRSLGAELVLTSRFEGTDGAQEVAKELIGKYPSKYFYADQYKNDNNWLAHYFTTAVEIKDAVPSISHFVVGLGTTGTFVGTGRRLKEMNSSIQLVALQPDLPLHGLEGWKHLETAAVPSIFDPQLADEQAEISTEEAYEMVAAIQKHEGFLVSPSSAANLVGAIKIGEKISAGTIVTIWPDDGSKYGEVIQQINANDFH